MEASMQHKQVTRRLAAMMVCLCIATGAAAAQMWEKRGYAVCIRDLAGAFPRAADLRHERNHYLARDHEQFQIFVNSQAWEDGQRVALRTRCDVAHGGDLLARETDHGRWVQQRGVISVEEMTAR
jgi:hypothetical protein